ERDRPRVLPPATKLPVSTTAIKINRSLRSEAFMAGPLLPLDRDRDELASSMLYPTYGDWKGQGGPVEQEIAMADAIKRVNPETLPDAGRAGYSQISIVEPARLAFVSGQVA